MIAYICTTVSDPDERAFLTELYLEFEKLIYSTANKYVAHPSDCEDVVQTAVVRLIHKVALLRTLERRRLAAYIVSTTRNTAFNHLRAQRRISAHLQFCDDNDVDTLPSDTPPLDEQLSMKEYTDKLSALWEQLPERERFLLEGRYLLGYSDGELAQQLGCKSSSIRMKLTRARRVALAQMGEGKHQR